MVSKLYSSSTKLVYFRQFLQFGSKFLGSILVKYWRLKLYHQFNFL